MNASLALSAEELSRVESESRGVLETHARSFSVASLFLPPKMQSDAALAYAFCRMVDDAVDEADCEATARHELDRIDAMLSWEGPATPLVRAYMDLCMQRGIGLAPARDLLKGARSDLGRVRLRTDEELLAYCYQVAGTVGLMMCGILGVTDPNARRNAIDLGIAMQLTNICRDVLEDAARDRVYLPATRLVAEGVHPVEVALLSQSEDRTVRQRVRQGVIRVVTDLLSEAERYYESGARGLMYIPRRPRLAIAVARSLYREIGVKLRARGSDPLQGRVRVGTLRKLILAAGCAMRWLFSSTRAKALSTVSSVPLLRP